MITNGSFDHFSDDARLFAFLETERTLKDGGVFLFACEYFEFNNKTWFETTKKDTELISMNCCASSNINLKKIIQKLSRLKIIQNRKKEIPAGQKLSDLPSADKAQVFTSITRAGLQSTWGSFFCVFIKRSPK